MSKSETGGKVSGVQLRSGESALVVGRPTIIKVWPKYLFTLGLYGIWRSRETSVLTDQRIIMGKGIFSRRERSIAMRRVNEASYARKGLAGYCEVKFQGGDRQQSVRLGPFRGRLARRFAQEIDDRT
jgi:hypothetical protein